MIIISENFSHYKVISAVGAGGMGEVFPAQDTKLDRKVAVKFLNDEFSRNAGKLKRFYPGSETGIVPRDVKSENVMLRDVLSHLI